mmetsp:Transcript_33351/g.72854  ORF Transcript_33351/g.72854 Transcript_33351/m.72854 type:complete len:488 (-) Transcript_33351:13-1476(-)
MRRDAWAASLLAFLIAVRGGFAAPTQEDGVLVLTEKNFAEAIKSNAVILVEFYAPWCGHCKQFATEYAQAALQLKQRSPPVPLAKVDATIEVKIAEEYGVRGYPTLRLFIGGQDQEYTGGRTAQSIVTWVTKRTGPPAIELPDVDSAARFEAENKLAVVGLFESSSQREAFDAVARKMEDIMFGYSATPAVVGTFDWGSVPAIRMFFPHDEKFAAFAGDVSNAAELEDFVKAYRFPLVSTFDGETAADLFGDGRPLLFLFRDKDAEGKAAEAQLRQAAVNLPRRVLLATAGSSEPMDQRLMDFVSVEPQEFPTLRIVVNPSGTMVKYKHTGEISVSSITTLLQDFEAGRLQPFLKSDDPPTSQSGPIHVLVGSTFQAAVKDPSKDVLVEFYAPWCGHCKKFEPVYREVATKLHGVETLTIAKIDATSNDVEGVDIEGFPTIKLWRGGNKDDPLSYDGERDVESLMSWLRSSVSFTFDGPGTPPKSEL